MKKILARTLLSILTLGIFGLFIYDLFIIPMSKYGLEVGYLKVILVILSVLAICILIIFVIIRLFIWCIDNI